MFSGLIEETSSVLNVVGSRQLLRLSLRRPKSFCSLKKGESIAVDGVCLTLEKFDKHKILFALAPETLKITKWTASKLKNKIFNLEKSLTLQSALGGHLLTGHVDGLAIVTEIKKKEESQILTVKVPKKFIKSFWKKGYITLNGVSLTINKIKEEDIEVCLIPETLKTTNLKSIKKAESLNFEVDYFTRIFIKNFSEILKSQYS